MAAMNHYQERYYGGNFSHGEQKIHECWHSESEHSIHYPVSRKGWGGWSEVLSTYKLVHSFAKLVTKLLANRLAAWLHDMVSLSQSMFIKGWFRQENFILVQQTARLLHQQKLLPLLLKLNISKAFNLFLDFRPWSDAATRLWKDLAGYQPHQLSCSGPKLGTGGVHLTPPGFTAGVSIIIDVVHSWHGCARLHDKKGNG